MLEIIALGLFSKKVRRIAEENNISAKKWLWRLILTWFGVEAVSIIAFMSMYGDSSKDVFLVGSLIGIALAVVSAFYNVNAMEREVQNFTMLQN